MSPLYPSDPSDTTAISKRIALETAVVKLSGRLTACALADIDPEIESGMRVVMEVTDATQICWYTLPEGVGAFIKTYFVAESNTPPPPDAVRLTDIPYTSGRLVQQEPVILHHLDELPAKSTADREFFQRISVTSVALIPSNCASDQGVLGVHFKDPADDCFDDSIPLLTILANLIAGTLERKAAHLARLEYERRFQALFEAAPIGFALEDLEGRLLFANPALSSILGYPIEELRGRTCAQFTHPDDVESDLDQFEQLCAGSISSYEIEKRFIRKDGTIIWGRVAVGLLDDRKGPAPLVIGMLQDITEKRRDQERLRVSESRLQHLSRQLIHAQDEERRRISQELHDNLGQSISLLAAGLDLLHQDLTVIGLGPESQRASVLHGDAMELATQIQDLSRKLYASKLQLLGLHVALQDLCHTISSQQRISVKVHVEGSLDGLPPEVAFCLFRIAQEALNNSGKYSNAAEVYVEVKRTLDKIRLKVQDFGVGFEPGTVVGGIGLSIMRERLLALGGELLVQSSTGKGTEILAQLDLTVQ